MDEILHQLGGLVLGSVPTMILFLLLVFAYAVLVQGPLDRTLAERRARTTGAMDQARGAIAAAEAETSVYEDKLRAAKAELFAARDRRLKQWQADREAALHLTRQTAQARLVGARQEIESGVTLAKSQIEGISAELSARILSAILPAGISTSTGAGQ